MNTLTDDDCSYLDYDADEFALRCIEDADDVTYAEIFSALEVTYDD